MELINPSVPISKYSFDLKFVFKYKSLFKVLDAFIIIFCKHTLINTNNLS